jgi:predicted enzyme related to lactoylglutathione lyase
MSERDSYEHGTPSWADHSSSDPESAARFYSELFGWELENVMPPESGQHYFMARVRGRDVAAVSGQMNPGPPVWTTYVTVDDADATAAKVSGAGGKVYAEPFDVFDSGRMAVLADNSGAPFSIWQAGQHTGAGLVNEPGAMCWNELMTRDPEGARRFYGEVFGWRTSAMPFEGGEYTLWHLAGEGEPEPRSDGVGGMISMVGEQWPTDLPPQWRVYFAVEDTDATVSRAEELGGHVRVPPFDASVGRMAALGDAAGAAFSVITLPS